MTTIAFCKKTQLLGADTRLNYESYSGYSAKISFPKKGIVLATAGDAGEGEWLRHFLSKADSIHDLYALTPDERPEFETLSAFIWWKSPFFVNEKLFPIPIETDYWSDGSGGDYALAYLALGWSMQDAIMGATRIDPNSGPPVHVVDLKKPLHTLMVFEDKRGTDIHLIPPKN